MTLEKRIAIALVAWLAPMHIIAIAVDGLNGLAVLWMILVISGLLIGGAALTAYWLNGGGHG